MCEVIEYFLDQKDSGSFRAFLTLVQEQRRIALEYIQSDLETFREYALQIVRDEEGDELRNLGTVDGLKKDFPWIGVPE